MDPVVVYGATGYTGGLLAEALAPRKVPLVLAGRSRDRLEARAAALPGDVEDVRVADAADPGALETAFAGAGCVASTAGPFLRVGRDVVDAAVASGAHYVDSTGEQAFARWVRGTQHEEAVERDVTAVPMLAFEYAPGDLASALLLDGEPADALDVVYDVRHGVATEGTRRSIVRVAARGGFRYEHGLLVPVVPGRTTTTFQRDGRERSAYAFPGGEVLTVPEHEDVGSVTTYMKAHPKTIRRLRLTAPLAQTLLKGPLLDAAERLATVGHQDPTEDDRAGVGFRVILEARRGDEARRMVVEGSDPYGLTAHALAEGATRLARGDGRTPGVVAPAQAFEPEGFLEALARAHGDLRWGPVDEDG